VEGSRLGIMGFCMGGRASYQMAALRSDLRAAVDLYGGDTRQGFGDGPAPFDLTAKITCPILILDGDQDQHPSPDEVRLIAAELERHGKVHEVHIYPGVGHAFMSAQGPRRRAEVVDDAWERLLGWFERYLVHEPALARG
ncbi:MAG TPA: dienelactone hydrolase family protein, partial [Chloroflexota bacterium]